MFNTQCSVQFRAMIMPSRREASTTGLEKKKTMSVVFLLRSKLEIRQSCLAIGMGNQPDQTRPEIFIVSSIQLIVDSRQQTVTVHSRKVKKQKTRKLEKQKSRKKKNRKVESKKTKKLKKTRKVEMQKSKTVEKLKR